MSFIDPHGCRRTPRGWDAHDRQRGARCGGRPTDRESTAPAGFHLHSAREGDALWIELYGELDLAAVPILERELKGARRRGIARVVVDLSGLEFIDSSGLHVLIDAQRRGDRDSYELELTRGSAPVQRLFALTGCEGLFRFLD